VKKNGLRQNIMIYEGKILDGRNRYRACMAVGEPLRTVKFLGDDPYEYVTAQNLLRRHISPKQRTLIAAEMANMKRGQYYGNQHEGSANWRKAESQPSSNDDGTAKTTAPIGGFESSATSQAQAAALLNVPIRTVQRAAVVINKGAPELVAAVRSYDVSISAAAALATLPKEEQAAIVAEGPEAITEAAKELRASKAADEPKDAPRPRQRLSMFPADIMLRTWRESSNAQRQRFLSNADPSVQSELERIEQGDL